MNLKLTPNPLFFNNFMVNHISYKLLALRLHMYMNINKHVLNQKPVNRGIICTSDNNTTTQCGKYCITDAQL